MHLQAELTTGGGTDRPDPTHWLYTITITIMMSN